MNNSLYISGFTKHALIQDSNSAFLFRAILHNLSSESGLIILHSCINATGGLEASQRLIPLRLHCSIVKVETIGDAYMVVSGAPEISETHAQKVSNFAMDMVEEAANVPSPATGLPIQVCINIILVTVDVTIRNYNCESLHLSRVHQLGQEEAYISLSYYIVTYLIQKSTA